MVSFDLVKPKIQRVGIAVGELSGDILGASLITALKARFPHVVFEGIGGSRMLQAGFHSLYPLEDIAVMGLIEPLKRLPKILSIRRGLYQHFLKNPPDVFIGIDAPDFNLTLEEKLRNQGICTVQYVGPTIWAWRAGRIHKIKRAADKVLVLFPFEKSHYDKMAIEADCVGHPLADEIELDLPKHPARAQLGLEKDVPIVTILPGSRKGVLKYLSEPFIETAKWLHEALPEVQFLVASANQKRADEFAALLKKHHINFSIKIMVDQTRVAITASDAVLLASGTGTLETMLLKKPMVVAYKMSKIGYMLAKRLIKVDAIALPNLLAGRKIVPEFIQDALCPKKMGQALLKFLKEDNSALKAEFRDLHLTIRRHASERAADQISETIQRHKVRTGTF